jgi:hypothetical protein
MPIKLQIDQESQLTQFIASGTISSTDITTALESFFQVRSLKIYYGTFVIVILVKYSFPERLRK